MDFFIWRGCDVTSARQVINTNADTISRAAALLTAPGGVPDDPAGGPTICIVSASWSDPVNTGRGQLAPGTYQYRLIPIDTCTGQTGAPYDMPDLVITELGQQATMSVVFCEYPNDCLSVLIQRNGILVGDAIPLTPQIDDYPTVRQLDVEGEYENGTTSSIRVANSSDSPYDLRGVDHPDGPDVIELQVTNGARPGRASVVVQEVSVDGPTKVVKFAPPLTASPELKPYSFMDIAQRTGLYLAPPTPGFVQVLVPNIFPFSILYPYIPFVNPWFAFTSIPVPSGFGFTASIVPYSATENFSPKNEMRVTGLSGMGSNNVGRQILLKGIGLPITGNDCKITVPSPYNGTVTISNIRVSGNPIPLDDSFVGSKIKLILIGPLGAEFEITRVVNSTTVEILNTLPVTPPSGEYPDVPWELYRMSISGCFTVTEVISSSEALVSTGVDPNPNPPSPGEPPAPARLPAVPDPNNGLILWAAISIAVPKPGDVITWLDRTGLVVKVDIISLPFTDETTAPFSAVNVAVIPFNFLAIPWPAGIYRIVNRPQWPASIGNYYIDLQKEDLSGGTGDANKVYQELYAGVVSSATSTTLRDSSQAWKTNELATSKVKIIRGTGEGQEKVISSNTSNTITVDSSWGTTPDNTSFYAVTSSAGVEYGEKSLLKFEVRGNGNSVGVSGMGPGSPLDTGIAVGRSVSVDGKILSIVNVQAARRLGDLTPDIGSDWFDYVVVTANPFPEPADSGKPLSGAVFWNPKVAYGVYITLSLELSPFIDRTGISEDGTFKRVTRTTSLESESALWMNVESGQNQTRSGDIPETSLTTFNTLDQIIAQAGYRGGATALLEKLRGPTRTLTNRSFNDSIGRLIQTRPKERYFAVNRTASLGNCDTINIVPIRDLRVDLCGEFSTVYEVAVFLSTHEGLAVMRMEEVTRVLPPEACPPDQPNITVTELVCRGIAEAMPSKRVKATEKMKVFWSGDAFNRPGAYRRLRDLGFSDAEASAALTFTPSGRVLSVSDISTLIQGIVDLQNTGALIDDILSDVRIRSLSPCPITPEQIEDIISNRGSGGVVRRPIGTDPDEEIKIDDFSPTTVNLLDLVATNSFNMCDFDAVIQAIPSETIRNTLAAVMAIVESATDGLKFVAEELRKWWFENPYYLAAKETIATLTAAINADPGLGCFLGPMNANGAAFGLPTIPAIEEGVLSFAGQFSIRLSITRFVMSLLEALACKIINALVSLIPLSAQADVQRLIGCLPSLGDLLALFPNLDLDLTLMFQCNFELYRLILRIIQAIISEINEIINLISKLTAGFINRSAQAANLACSSDQNLSNVVAQAASALGLPSSIVTAIAG